MSKPWMIWGIHHESDCIWPETEYASSEEKAWELLQQRASQVADQYCDFDATNLSLIIAGSRNLTISIEGLEQKLYEERLFPAEIVSGTCRGIDKSGELFAAKHNLSVVSFPADWSQGKMAGPKRNKQMAEYADALLLIWDGKSRGSLSMKRAMQYLGKPVYEIIV